MITDVDMAMMLEKICTDAGDEFAKTVEPVVKSIDMRYMTNEDLLMHCRRAFEAGVTKGIGLIPSIHKNLGIPFIGM